MKYVLIFTDQYERRARRFLKRHPEMERPYLKTLQLLQANPFHPSLRLHRLAARLSNLHSVSITLSYRITLEFLIDGEEIIPVAWGITIRSIDAELKQMALFPASAAQTRTAAFPASMASCANAAPEVNRA